MIFDPGWLGRGRGRAVSLSFDYSTLKTITKRLFSKKNDYTASAHRFDYSALKTITKRLFFKKTITFPSRGR
ncbi:hypothetical protein PQR70_15780 [Paraburkholderia madseniana]|uniref:hypothetical protein n=1 Tax=Paraburkholderia madseniana TaxID=2599607 RepID=UPI0038B71741